MPSKPPVRLPVCPPVPLNAYLLIDFQLPHRLERLQFYTDTYTGDRIALESRQATGDHLATEAPFNQCKHPSPSLADTEDSTF